MGLKGSRMVDGAYVEVLSTYSMVKCFLESANPRSLCVIVIVTVITQELTEFESSKRVVVEMETDPAVDALLMLMFDDTGLGVRESLMHSSDLDVPPLQSLGIRYHSFVTSRVETEHFHWFQADRCDSVH